MNCIPQRRRFMLASSTPTLIHQRQRILSSYSFARTQLQDPSLQHFRVQGARFSASSSGGNTTNISGDLSHLSISTNPYDLDSHGRGESYHPIARPDAVATPQNVEEVVDIVKYCSANRIPIIPYGAGTSVEGHTCALHGGVSLDMSLFDSIEWNDEDPGMVMVGAGVPRKRLNEELRHSGLHFVVDPGADATIGGMVACGASGTTAARYGTMRENILGLTCVLPDGTVSQCGGRVLKSSAGYDLTSLMTGSEGTLGIITNVTVKLHPIPEHVLSAVCAFDDLHAAAEAVTAMKFSGISMVRCELLDSTSVAAFNQHLRRQASSRGKGSVAEMDEKPTLFLEFQGPSQAAVQEEVSMADSLCTGDYEASNFQYASDEEARRALWSARHGLYYAALALRKGSNGAVVTDACVPLSKFADLISATAQDVMERGIIGPCFGHAGDGNFHCIMPVLETDSEEYLAILHEVNDTLIQRTLEAGGTCTGEHGVGYGKMKYLEQQYGTGGVHMMRLVKSAIDPLNIMNPGKVLFPEQLA